MEDAAIRLACKKIFKQNQTFCLKNLGDVTAYLDLPVRAYRIISLKSLFRRRA